jgi:hypothetical protein
MQIMIQLPTKQRVKKCLYSHVMLKLSIFSPLSNLRINIMIDA